MIATLVTGLDRNHADAGVVVRARDGRIVCQSHPAPVGQTWCVGPDGALLVDQADAALAALGCLRRGPWRGHGEPHTASGFDAYTASVRPTTPQQDEAWSGFPSLEGAGS